MSTNETTAHIAVFGDIHGRVSLMLLLAKHWQKQTGISLDAIVQVGDFGAYPDHSKLDKATVKHAKRDSDELGFADYCRPSKEGQKLLDNEELPITYFIKGNHEDFDYIDRFQQPDFVDPWQKLLFIPNGHSASIEKEDLVLQIAGMGNVPPKQETRHSGKTNRKLYRKAQQRAQLNPKYFTEQEVKRAFLDPSEKIDILLTHAGPQIDDLPQGSTLLSELSQRIKPRVHCFGHHHRVIGPELWSHDRMLIGLDHLDFHKSGTLCDDAWGILQISKSDKSFQFANHATMSWLSGFNRRSYRKLFL